MLIGRLTPRAHRGTQRRAAGFTEYWGFTMLELLIVMAVILVLAVVTMSNFKQVMLRAKLQGDAAALSNAIQRARSVALRQSKIVVGEISGSELTFWFDENGNLVQDDDDPGDPGDDDEDEDLEAAPAVALSPGRIPETTVRFWSYDAAPGDPAAMDGFTTRTTDPWPILVIDPDGSVRDLGGFRIGMGASPHDGYNANFMEVRVVIAATGRTQLRKYIPDRIPASAPPYQPRIQNADGPNWKFY